MSEIARPTRTHLAQWKRLAEEATEGPWEAARNRPVSGSDFYSVDAGDEIVASPGLVPDRAGPQASADVDFIAASRQAVPALIAEVEALRAERDAAREFAAAWKECARSNAEGRRFAEGHIHKWEVKFFAQLDYALRRRDERDAALARIEKVREVLEGADQGGVIVIPVVVVRRALDGGEEGA